MLKPIKTKKDYKDALPRAYGLMQKDMKKNITPFLLTILSKQLNSNWNRWE